MCSQDGSKELAFLADVLGHACHPHGSLKLDCLARSRRSSKSVDQHLVTPVTSERPPAREKRQNVLLTAQVFGFGGYVPTQHRVRDVSTRGARIDQASSLRAGATVLISVGLLEEVAATVMWVKSDLAGLRFAEAINPEAARAKAAISPSRPSKAGRTPAVQDDRAVDGIGAGWAADLNSPYRLSLKS
jgi:transcriptional regulator GlxA family with amidase domain